MDCQAVATPKLKVYVAGPITIGDLRFNINQAREAGKRLMHLGYAPLCPQLTCFLGGDTPTVDGGGFSWDTWMEVCRPWVAVSEALLRLPGLSVGADREVDLAQSLSIPVFHSVDELHAANLRPICKGGDPDFLRTLDEMRELHLKKGADYANAQEPLLNYVQSAKDNGIPSWLSAQCRLSEKYHRLMNLTRKNTEPNNESIDESLIDLSSIAIIVKVLRNRKP